MFFEDVLNASTGFSSTAPAIFAAVTRFSTARLNPGNSTWTIVLGAVVAAAGAGLLAGSANFVAALGGLSVAAAGTAVLYPTLLGVASRATSEAARGRATSLFATVSYLGFLLGPVYIGLFFEAAGLRGAMIAVAALSALLFLPGSNPASPHQYQFSAKRSMNMFQNMKWLNEPPGDRRGLPALAP